MNGKEGENSEAYNGWLGCMEWMWYFKLVLMTLRALRDLRVLKFYLTESCGK